jgi:hypothetical protein
MTNKAVAHQVVSHKENLDYQMLYCEVCRTATMHKECGKAYGGLVYKCLGSMPSHTRFLKRYMSSDQELASERAYEKKVERASVMVLPSYKEIFRNCKKKALRIVDLD